MAGASDLRLADGPLAADLVPAIGGSVAALRWHGADVLRPLSAADRAAGNALGVAIFPMLPVANRIAGNAFRFEGRRHAVAANNPPERFHVHGTGWHAAWTVAEASATAARITLAHTGDPWSYRAAQSFALAGATLDLRLTLENTGPHRMPFGFGWHPWFPRDPDVRLSFRATRFYLEEPEGVSGDPINLPPELDFTAGSPLPQGLAQQLLRRLGRPCDPQLPRPGHCAGHGRHAGAGAPSALADPAKPYFCLEPQSMASGALNRAGGIDDPGQGVLPLEPGATIEAGLRLTVRPL